MLRSLNAVRSGNSWLIYGADEPLGRLCAVEAVRRGMRPVIAGSDARLTCEIGDMLSLETRVFGLSAMREERIDCYLRDVDLVLNCQYSTTSGKLLFTCPRTKTHYIDTSGEIGTFEAIFYRFHDWEREGVIALPGVGFNVVASDCLAGLLKRELPDATRLCIAFGSTKGKVHPCTLKSVSQSISEMACI